MLENLSHYRILNRIGAGGMGEVFLAEDVRLGRKVALKILPANFTNDEHRVRRFAQEARAASALNHPNIITIHDIGETEGRHYIATEFIEGDTLRQLLVRGGLPLGEALEIALQAASALGAAHTAGIVHRDIKPENLMRRPDGYLKVLDFGLAKLTEQSSSEELEAATRPLFETAPGSIMGTAAYMSPEQARGLRVDARTDLFSLGVVLYEMITGKRPFVGATKSDLLVSILERQPLPISYHLSGVSPDLERVVRRLLEKDVSARYQSTAELVSDLKPIKGQVDSGAEAPTSTAPGFSSERSRGLEEEPTIAAFSGSLPPDAYATSITSPGRTDETKAGVTAETLESSQRGKKKWWIAGALGVLLLALGLVFVADKFRGSQRIDSIAVLPFVIESADRNTEYLGDGITEGLINTLSQLPELTVMSRNSVFRFKGREADAKEVGTELNVQSVLLGRIKQQGDELVISSELVDARTRRQIWGQQFRRKPTDLISLQEQIVGAIADRLRLRLTADDQRLISARPTENGEAYQAYLRGRYFWNVGTPQALKQADENFEKAAGLDPRYTLAIAGCAASHAFGADYLEAPIVSMPKAKQGALVVLKRDDRIVDAHLVLARVSWMYDRDYATAERKFKRALELDSSNSAAYEQYGQFLALMGRSDEALTSVNRARELDPTSAHISQTAGMVFYYQRRYDEAIRVLNQAVELDPKMAIGHEWMGMAYERKGTQLEAIEQYLIARRIADDRPDYLMGLKEAYAHSNWKGFWRRELEENTARAANGYLPATRFAEAYLRLDDRPQALKWLERASEERDGRIVALKVDPAFDSLRGEARFLELLKRVGFAP